MAKLKLFTTTILASAVLALVGCGGEDNKDNTNTAIANNDTVVWKVAFNQPENHPEYRALEMLSEKLQEESNGKYVLEIFPNALLGSQKNTIEMVQSGNLQFSLVAGSLLENWNEDFAVFNLPYIFKDYKHLLRVVENKEVVGDLFKSLEDHNISILTAMYTGARNIYTKEGIEIRTPEDLQDMKIRVMQSNNMVDIINTMGGAGIPLEQGEVYSSIQASILEGAENNAVTYYALKHYEVAPTYNLTNHMMMPDYLITNKAFFTSLPSNIQQFFHDNLPEIVKTEFTMFQEEIDKSLEKAKQEGVVVVESDQESFKKLLEPLIEKKVNSSDYAKKLYASVNELRDVEDNVQTPSSSESKDTQDLKDELTLDAQSKSKDSEATTDTQDVKESK